MKCFSGSVLKRLAVLVCIGGALYSCKKSSPLVKKDEPEKEDTTSTGIDTVIVPPTREELTRDSIFYYAKEVYLWQDALPADTIFKPRSFKSQSTPLLNYEKELYAITQYPKMPGKSYSYEYVNTGAYPKYSYITDITTQNPVASIKSRKSSVDLEGNGYDFGLSLGAYGSPTAYKIYVKAVYPGSPAALAGLKRGDNFNVINGTTIGSNYNSEFNLFYNAFFESAAITLKGKTRGGADLNVSLARASYKSSPIYKDTIITVGAKKIGYMSYARFSNPSNSTGEFDRVFGAFKAQGVTDLIIDLRYNGGGYVSSAEYLINLIAPAAKSGTTMFTEYYNNLMQQNYAVRNSKPTAPLLAKQYILDANDSRSDQNHDGKWDTYADIDFSPSNQTTRFSRLSNSLSGINKVAFIVSDNTASASELVINSLKPHMAVKVFGEKSYGKPVGFFPIRIDKYDVYFSMFQTKNSEGKGDYFEGIAPDVVADDILAYDTWDIREASMAAAYSYITSSTVSSVSSKQTSKVLAKAPAVLEIPGKSLSDLEFKGMIENRVKIK